ncbi:hypothetical protein VaNZ11_016535 [Volvox africanus]|uniref:Uncharacterized protein n=1 Tax=Volvox africanus TaxID=51714 RepID=A0ABQ5SP53_9CHLO|nr:hypothetical protein VaNZ11_016535 [Volvox africanus]
MDHSVSCSETRIIQIAEGEIAEGEIVERMLPRLPDWAHARFIQWEAGFFALYFPGGPIPLALLTGSRFSPILAHEFNLKLPPPEDAGHPKDDSQPEGIP